MAETDTQNEGPVVRSASLRAPREAAVVNGDEITFVWESVDEADAYVLQVARTARFNDIVVEERFEDETAVTIVNTFPTDNQTFFWRVLTGKNETFTRGDRVESFIAASEEDARKHHASASRSEDLGPATELVRAAGQDVSTKMLEPVDRFEQEKEIGVAYEGIAATQILAIAVSVLLVIGVAVVVLFSWAGQIGQQAGEVSVDPGRYSELREAEIEAARQLEQYEVVNEEDGVYRIPIDRAMEIIANEEYQASQNASPGEANTGDDGATSTP